MVANESNFLGGFKCRATLPYLVNFHIGDCILSFAINLNWSYPISTIQRCLYRQCHKLKTKGAINWVGTAYLSGVHPQCIGRFVFLNLYFMDCCLSFYLFSFSHCIAPLQLTDCDYTVGIVKHFAGFYRFSLNDSWEMRVILSLDLLIYPWLCICFLVFSSFSCSLRIGIRYTYRYVVICTGSKVIVLHKFM